MNVILEVFLLSFYQFKASLLNKSFSFFKSILTWLCMSSTVVHVPFLFLLKAAFIPTNIVNTDVKVKSLVRSKSSVMKTPRWDS